MIKEFLEKKGFLAFVIIQFFNSFKDNFFNTAVITTVTLTSFKFNNPVDPKIVTYAVGAIFISPFLFFSSFAGELTDKNSKPKVIRMLKIAEFATALIAAIGFHLADVYIISAVLFMAGIQSTMFGPVKYSIIPELVGREYLLKANAIVEASSFIGILMGAIIGSTMAIKVSHPVFLTIFMIIVSAVGFFCSVKLPNLRVSAPNLQINKNFISSSYLAIKKVYEKPVLFLTIIGISWFWLLGHVYITTLAIVTRDILKGHSFLYTFFLSTFTVGIAAGSFTCTKIQKRRLSFGYILGSLLLITFFMYDYSNFIVKSAFHEYHSLAEFLSRTKNIRLTLDLFFISFFGGIYSVPLYTLLQRYTSRQSRSRVIGANNIMNAVFVIFASLMLMFVEKVLGVPLTVFFKFFALMNLAVIIYLCMLEPVSALKYALRRVLSVLFRIEIKGFENYYRSGKRTLIVANHESYLDPILLAIFLPDQITFAINTYQSQRWFIKPVLKLVNAFPIDPSKPIAIKELIKVVKSNKHVVIFPEGRITTTGSLMKIYEGPAMIALKSKANILPIRIKGAGYSIFSRMQDKRKIKLFPKIELSILPHQQILESGSASKRRDREYAGLRLYDIMSDMIFKTQSYHISVFNAVLGAARVHGYGTTIVNDPRNNPLTYAKLITASYLIGSKINCLTKNPNVGIMLPTSNAAVVSILGLMSCKKIPVMLNFTSGSFNIITACETAVLDHIITSKEFIRQAQLEEIVKQLKDQKIKIIYLEDLKAQFNIFEKLISLAKMIVSRFLILELKRKGTELEKPAVILFTSGSEGKVKAVVLSNKNILSNISQVTARVDFLPNDQVLNALPVFHSYSLTAGTLLPLITGIKSFLYPTPLHYRIIPEMIYDLGATIFFATNTFLTGYAKYAHPYDFFSLRYVFAGAEKLKDETRRIWAEKFGIRVLEGYGVTETSPVISINTAMHCKYGTVGRILPGMAYKIKPVDGIDEGGELLVSGPNIMMGYIQHNEPGVIQPVKEGFHETGDVVKIDDEGYITIFDRVKRFAKLGGEMVSLTAVEENVSKITKEQMICGAISIADDKKGEQIILVSSSENLTRAAIQEEFKKNGITELYVPRKVIYMKELPLLGTGKINYPKLKQMVLEKNN